MSIKTSLHLIVASHGVLMRLYPPAFRATFGYEMQDVFSKNAIEASGKGTIALIKVFLLELRDFPVTALKERILERRMSAVEAEGHVSQTDERLTRKEMLVALAVFLIPAGFILLNTTPPSISRVVITVMLAMLLIGSVAGLVKRFPRWSLPYFGLVVSSIVFLFLFQRQAQRIGALLASRFVHQPGDELSRLLLVTFWDGIVWFSLLVIVSLAILLLALLPGFHHIIQRLWEDWTRLSYLFYGCSMLALVLTFDEYNYEGPYALIALLCLAIGAWGYLRSSRPRQRFLALLVGLTLAIWVASVVKWLVPSLDWTVWFRGHLPDSERWIGAEQVFIGWAWMVVVMALPRLLKLLPQPRGPTMTE